VRRTKAFLQTKQFTGLIAKKLIKEAKKESAAAQKCLFDLMSDKMILVCRRYVKNYEDAEELLLDGFYKFFKTLSSFTYQTDGGVYAWLKKIMINECLAFLRKKHSSLKNSGLRDFFYFDF